MGISISNTFFDEWSQLRILGAALKCNWKSSDDGY